MICIMAAGCLILHNAFVSRVSPSNKKLQKMIQDQFVRFIDPKEVLFWIPHGKIENFPKNNTIFYKGHFPIGLYIFTQGSISIEFIRERKANHIILRKPTMLALNHILESTPNKYTVRTMEPSQLIFLPHNVFKKNSLLSMRS